MNDDERYRQLGLFSLIVAEVVFTPLVTGGILLFLFRNHALRTGIAVFGAIAGLGLAFFRIGIMLRKKNGSDTQGK
jgi:hypothetical protein